MKIDQTVALGVRLFAVFMFFNIVYSLGIILISMLSEPASLLMILGTGVIFSLLVATTACLWYHPEKVANHIIPPNTGNTVVTTIDTGKLARLLFGFLGLWIVIGATTDLVRDLFVYWQTGRFGSLPGNFWVVRAQGNAIADAVRLVLGLAVMVFGGKCFSGCCKVKKPD